MLISTMLPVPSALQNLRLLALLPLMVSKGPKHTVAAVCYWCAARWVDRFSTVGAEHVSSLCWSGVQMQCKCFAMLPLFTSASVTHCCPLHPLLLLTATRCCTSPQMLLSRSK